MNLQERVKKIENIAGYFILRRVRRFNFIKPVALVTLACFVITSFGAQAVAAVADTVRERKQASTLFDEFLIPHTAGRITEAKFLGSREVVINIQDLHCHYEVQKNISRILAVLDEKYKLPKVYLEGAFGQLDTSWLGKIEDKKLREEIVNSLLEQGKLTGVEHYSISSNRPNLIYGMERRDIYEANFRRLGEIMGAQDNIKKSINALSADINSVKNSYYNSSQKKFEKISEKYRDGNIDARKYYALIEKYSRRLDIDIYGYVNIVRYMNLMKSEKDLNYKRIAGQLYQFVGVLKKRLPYSVYNKLIESTNNFTQIDKLYLYLMKVTDEYNLNVVVDFPELGKFFCYLNDSRKVNPIALVSEEKKLSNEINYKLGANGSQRDVAFMVNYFKYFEEYFENKISADNYNYFVSNLVRFKTAWVQYAQNNSLSELDPYFSLLGDFYMANIERNNCFVKNTDVGSNEKQLNSVLSGKPEYAGDIEKTVESLKKAESIKVMVTGGFHTEGLKKIFEEKGISYIVVTPNVTQDTKLSEMVYSKLAKEQSKISFQAFALVALTSQTPDRQNITLVSTAIDLLISQGKNEEEIKEAFQSIFSSKEFKDSEEIKGNTISFDSFKTISEGKHELQVTIQGREYEFIYDSESEDKIVLKDSADLKSGGNISSENRRGMGFITAFITIIAVKNLAVAVFTMTPVIGWIAGILAALVTAKTFYYQREFILQTASRGYKDGIPEESQREIVKEVLKKYLSPALYNEISQNMIVVNDDALKVAERKNIMDGIKKQLDPADFQAVIRDMGVVNDAGSITKPLSYKNGIYYLHFSWFNNLSDVSPKLMKDAGYYINLFAAHELRHKRFEAVPGLLGEFLVSLGDLVYAWSSFFGKIRSNKKEVVIEASAGSEKKDELIEKLKIKNYGVALRKGEIEDFEPLLNDIKEQFTEKDIKTLTKELEGYALFEIAKVRPDLFTNKYINSIADADENDMSWVPKREVSLKGFFKLIEILKEKNPDAVKLDIKLKEKVKVSLSDQYESARQAIEDSHKNGVNDEFMEPAAIVDKNGIPVGLVEDGDRFVNLNFRPDRAKQITRAFVEPGFNKFPVQDMPNLKYIGFTLYDKAFAGYNNFRNAFSFEMGSVINNLGEYISKLGKKQLRASEDEKFAHVTYFLNGGTSKDPYPGEDRIIVKSKGGDYSKYPAMSIEELTEKVEKAILEGKDGEGYEMIVLNYPPADIVDHTADYAAAAKAVEETDRNLGRILKVLEKKGYFAIVTADHGDADQVRTEDGDPHTAHSLAQVPIIVFDPALEGRTEVSIQSGGTLGNIAPTFLDLNGRTPPEEMTHKSLLKNYPKELKGKKGAIIILDGWGARSETYGNAIHHAFTPNMDALLKLYPQSTLISAGDGSGLPEGVMGNSEAGHQNIGAGRKVKQSVTSISEAIKDGSFMENEVLLSAVREAKKNNTKFHIGGLLSNAGVHSVFNQAYPILDMAKEAGLSKDQVVFHLFLDGRDTPPKSSLKFLEELESVIAEKGIGIIGSLGGRSWGMDRIENWEKVAPHYNVMVYGNRTNAPSKIKDIVTSEKIAEDVIDLKRGDPYTNWWEKKVLERLKADPTPWGDDAIIPIMDKGVLKLRFTSKFLEEYDKEKNKEGRGIWKYFKKYETIGPLAIAGIRHIMNISNIHDTRRLKNSFEKMLTAVSLGLMIKIKYNKGANFPYLANYGHEVRYQSDENQEIITRTLAAMGFVMNVVPNNVPTAIWNTSTMGKFFDFVLSFCGTASHSESEIDGLKIMDYEGSQFLTEDIESMIAIQRAILEKIKKDGYFDFTLSAANDPRITDELYQRTHNGMYVYKKYQESAAADKMIMGLVKELDPSQVHIDCAHGSAYRTLDAFFKEMGLSGIASQFDWMHKEERPDFGNIGKLLEDPKTGKETLYDMGADGTQLMERVLPSGKIAKYFPVLGTADYPQKFAAMPIGDIILHTDMDNDRLYVTQILRNDEQTRALLDEIGVVYNVINNEKLAAVFIPNKFFHFLHEMNFNRLAELMKRDKKDGGIDKSRTLVVLKTLASTPALDKWAAKRKQEGYKVAVINTAVGFAKLANVMYRIEGEMKKRPGKDVFISDASGDDINVGSNPLIIAAWEESGGIITGLTYDFEDILGNPFLAEREKSATESIFLSLAMLSKLQKEKGNVNLAVYLKELYDRDEIDTPIDIRFDNKLFVPGTSAEADKAEAEGNEKKARIFGAHISLVLAYKNKQIDIAEARRILRDIFNQEHEAKKLQGTLNEAMLVRYKNVDIDSLVDIKFTGDGVIFKFAKEGKEWFILFRPSGTEPKLKAYGFGKDTQRITDDTWVFSFTENTAGQLPESFMSNKSLMKIWGKTGQEALDKAIRMQTSWELYGVVVDPQDLDETEFQELQKKKLVRTFDPPNDHILIIQQWLKEQGLGEFDIDLSKQSVMPQQDIIALLEAIPEGIYKKLGRTKEEVLAKERVDDEIGKGNPPSAEEALNELKTEEVQGDGKKEEKGGLGGALNLTIVLSSLFLAFNALTTIASGSIIDDYEYMDIGHKIMFVFFSAMSIGVVIVVLYNIMISGGGRLIKEILIEDPRNRRIAKAKVKEREQHREDLQRQLRILLRADITGKDETGFIEKDLIELLIDRTNESKDIILLSESLVRLQNLRVMDGQGQGLRRSKLLAVLKNAPDKIGMGGSLAILLTLETSDLNQAQKSEIIEDFIKSMEFMVSWNDGENQSYSGAENAGHILNVFRELGATNKQIFDAFVGISGVEYKMEFLKRMKLSEYNSSEYLPIIFDFIPPYSNASDILKEGSKILKVMKNLGVPIDDFVELYSHLHKNAKEHSVFSSGIFTGGMIEEDVEYDIGGPKIRMPVQEYFSVHRDVTRLTAVDKLYKLMKKLVGKKNLQEYEAVHEEKGGLGGALKAAVMPFVAITGVSLMAKTASAQEMAPAFIQTGMFSLINIAIALAGGGIIALVGYLLKRNKEEQADRDAQQKLKFKKYDVNGQRDGEKTENEAVMRIKEKVESGEVVIAMQGATKFKEKKDEKGNVISKIADGWSAALACRLAGKNIKQIVIGSRSEDNSKVAAECVLGLCPHVNPNLLGSEKNINANKKADIIVLGVPQQAVISSVLDIRFQEGVEGKIVWVPGVHMGGLTGQMEILKSTLEPYDKPSVYVAKYFNDYREWHPELSADQLKVVAELEEKCLNANSMGEVAAIILGGTGNVVVNAGNNIPAYKMAQLGTDLPYDVEVCSDNELAGEIIAGLIKMVAPNLKPVVVPLSRSAAMESKTPWYVLYPSLLQLSVKEFEEARPEIEKIHAAQVAGDTEFDVKIKKLVAGMKDEQQLKFKKYDVNGQRDGEKTEKLVGFDEEKAEDTSKRHATLGEQISEVAKILNIREKGVQEAFRNGNYLRLMQDFAETTGIKNKNAVDNMIKAGIAVESSNELGYVLESITDAKICKFIELQRNASSNPAEVDLPEIGIERIIENHTEVDKFMDSLVKTSKMKSSEIVEKLNSNGLLPGFVSFWEYQEAVRNPSEEKVPLLVDGFVNPKANEFYKSKGVEVDFSIPKGRQVPKNIYDKFKLYARAKIEDMKRGGYNYRGTGTKTTIKQFFDEKFAKDKDEIIKYVQNGFGENIEEFGLNAKKLKVIITVGIGANDQFMWQMVEMYNKNRAPNDPVWYHIIPASALAEIKVDEKTGKHIVTEEDFEKLRKGEYSVNKDAKLQEKIDRESTLVIHISRSGETWEVLEVANRLAAAGFKKSKTIALANGGDLTDLSGLKIGMSPDIGGRLMLPKTSIYYTVQTIAGMFVKEMDSQVFAYQNDEYDKANDFAKGDESLPVALGEFLFGAMDLMGVDQMMAITNTKHLAMTVSSWNQFIMEGANKKHIITMGNYDLTKMPEGIIEAESQKPNGKMALVVLDKAAKTYKKDLRMVNKLKKKMPLILMTVDSSKTKNIKADGSWKGISPNQESAFDMLWVDWITVLTTLMRGSASSNPEVKAVRENTAEYTGNSKEIEEIHNNDALGKGDTRLLTSVADPENPGIGTPEKQIPLKEEDDKEMLGFSLNMGMDYIKSLAEKGQLKDRDRLTVGGNTGTTFELAEKVRYKIIKSELVTKYGWRIGSAQFPHYAHKGMEALLSLFVARRSIYGFINERKIGDSPVYDDRFEDATPKKKNKAVNGANMHITNDSGTFPNFLTAEKVAPTILHEVMQIAGNEKYIEAFYDGLVEQLLIELGKIENSTDPGIVGTAVKKFEQNADLPGRFASAIGRIINIFNTSNQEWFKKNARSLVNKGIVRVAMEPDWNNLSDKDKNDLTRMAELRNMGMNPVWLTLGQEESGIEVGKIIVPFAGENRILKIFAETVPVDNRQAKVKGQVGFLHLVDTGKKVDSDQRLILDANAKTADYRLLFGVASRKLLVDMSQDSKLTGNLEKIGIRYINPDVIELGADAEFANPKFENDPVGKEVLSGSYTVYDASSKEEIRNIDNIKIVEGLPEFNLDLLGFAAKESRVDLNKVGMLADKTIIWSAKSKLLKYSYLNMNSFFIRNSTEKFMESLKRIVVNLYLPGVRNKTGEGFMKNRGILAASASVYSMRVDGKETDPGIGKLTFIQSIFRNILAPAGIKIIELLNLNDFQSQSLFAGDWRLIDCEEVSKEFLDKEFKEVSSEREENVKTAVNIDEVSRRVFNFVNDNYSQFIGIKDYNDFISGKDKSWLDQYSKEMADKTFEWNKDVNISREKKEGVFKVMQWLFDRQERKALSEIASLQIEDKDSVQAGFEAFFEINVIQGREEDALRALEYRLNKGYRGAKINADKEVLTVEFIGRLEKVLASSSLEARGRVIIPAGLSGNAIKAIEKSRYLEPAVEIVNIGTDGLQGAVRQAVNQGGSSIFSVSIFRLIGQEVKLEDGLLARILPLGSLKRFNSEIAAGLREYLKTVEIGTPVSAYAKGYKKALGLSLASSVGEKFDIVNDSMKEYSVKLTYTDGTLAKELKGRGLYLLLKVYNAMMENGESRTPVEFTDNKIFFEIAFEALNNMPSSVEKEDLLQHIVGLQKDALEGDERSAVLLNSELMGFVRGLMENILDKRFVAARRAFPKDVQYKKVLRTALLISYENGVTPEELFELSQSRKDFVAGRNRIGKILNTENMSFVETTAYIYDLIETKGNELSATQLRAEIKNNPNLTFALNSIMTGGVSPVELAGAGAYSENLRWSMSELLRILDILDDWYELSIVDEVKESMKEQNIKTVRMLEGAA